MQVHIKTKYTTNVLNTPQMHYIGHAVSMPETDQLVCQNSPPIFARTNHSVC